MKKKRSISIKLDIKLKLFILIIIIVICLLIGLILVSLKKDESLVTEYKSDYINFIYDNNFELVDDKDYIQLTDKDKTANIVIKKIDYTNNAKTKNQYEIASSLSFQVIQSEEGYIETYNGSEKVNELNRYYYLYENYDKERQVEVITIFDKEYIYVVIYSADNEEFDLYTESISLIVDSTKV